MENCEEIGYINMNCIYIFIKKKYGYDFSNYKRSVIDRRIMMFFEKKGIKDTVRIIEFLDESEMNFITFLSYVSIGVTEMFRNPEVFKEIRNSIIPLLNSKNMIKIWICGCSTGEEVYSLSIILYEENVKDKTIIYATDYNPYSVEKSKMGIYSSDIMRKYSKNYILSGGKRDFSDYYYSNYGYAIFKEYLKKNIVFNTHDIIKNTPLQDIDMIMCRNVLIYMDDSVHRNVLEKFVNSLNKNGVIVLGKGETAMNVKGLYPFNRGFSIYKKEI